MDKYKLLKKLELLYHENVNIIEYLNQLDSKEKNSAEDIMIAYDFQAGSYLQAYKKNREYSKKYINAIAKVIEKIDCSKQSIFECGVGEATTLVPLLKELGNNFSFSGGNDISWSRIAVAQKFAESEGIKTDLAVANMFELPLADNSIDIVYTSHSLEPNGGYEKQLLQELYRVTREYLILLEPAYELADENAQKRMKQHGYVTNLCSTARELNYDIEEYRIFDVYSNPLNPTGLMVIRKHAIENPCANTYCCPITKRPLVKYGNAYFAPESLLAYPIMNGVPCLLREQAVVATKLNLLYEKKE